MSKNIYSQVQATAVALAEGEIERLTMMRYSLLVSDAVPSTFPSPFEAYSKQTTVVMSPANYKNVRVQVSNIISGNITLTTLVANDW
jgi:hypothetical protein